jgi:hypothetical protein
MLYALLFINAINNVYIEFPFSKQSSLVSKQQQKKLIELHSVSMFLVWQPDVFVCYYLWHYRNIVLYLLTSKLSVDRKRIEFLNAPINIFDIIANAYMFALSKLSAAKYSRKSCIFVQHIETVCYNGHGWHECLLLR